MEGAAFGGGGLLPQRFAVRFAEPGETVVTLDDITRTLDPGDVLIVDDVATLVSKLKNEAKVI